MLWHQAGVSGPEQDAMGNVCLAGLDGISVDKTVTQALGHQRLLGLLLEEGRNTLPGRPAGQCRRAAGLGPASQALNRVVLG